MENINTYRNSRRVFGDFRRPLVDDGVRCSVKCLFSILLLAQHLEGHKL